MLLFFLFIIIYYFFVLFIAIIFCLLFLCVMRPYEWTFGIPSAFPDAQILFDPSCYFLILPIAVRSELPQGALLDF